MFRELIYQKIFQLMLHSERERERVALMCLQARAVHDGLRQIPTSNELVRCVQCLILLFYWLIVVSVCTAVWTWEHRRVSPPRFLAECHKTVFQSSDGFPLNVVINAGGCEKFTIFSKLVAESRKWCKIAI